MHYTSWDRTNREAPRLIADDDREAVIGEFSDESAVVDGQHWALSVDPRIGASATTDDDRVFRIIGDLTRSKKLDVSLEGRTFSFINESGRNWIIDNAEGEKVAQFSGVNSGVRKAIVEYAETAKSMEREELAALAWFSRLILEQRLKTAALPLIITLVLATVVAIGAVLV